MSNDQLRELGWMPWVLVQVPVGTNQVLDGSTTQINLADIVETQDVRDMTPDEIQGRDKQERDSNKHQAEARLYETDWTTIPDISNPAVSDPYLTNVAEFIAYRNNIRKIAVNPPATIIEWPEVPESVWNNVT
jgi:hypothetical protein